MCHLLYDRCRYSLTSILSCLIFVVLSFWDPFPFLFWCSSSMHLLYDTCTNAPMPFSNFIVHIKFIISDLWSMKKFKKDFFPCFNTLRLKFLIDFSKLCYGALCFSACNIFRREYLDLGESVDLCINRYYWSQFTLLMISC